MEYLIGLGVALAVAGLGSGVGFGRDRCFGPTVLIVTAGYYVLFAAVGGSTRSLVVEIVVACGFVLVAVIAFTSNLWLIPGAMAAHGVFDFFHHSLIQNSGVPVWWPGFCIAFDVIFGGWLGVVLLRRSQPALGAASPHPSHDARS